MYAIHHRIRATISAAAISLASLALCACGGSGAGLDQNGRPLTLGSSGAAITADFGSIQDNVFTPICTACHAGANAPLGLRLDAANSYALLVNVNSVEVPTQKRVAPGNANASYIVQKLRGTAAVGARMPLGGPYLPDTTIDAIAQWIQNGAPRASSVAPGESLSQANIGGLRVVTAAPENGAVVARPLRQLVIGFDRELDANLVNATTVQLERADTHAPIAVDFIVPITTPSTLLINPREALGSGSYQLVLRGSGGGALAGLDAVPLNSTGDFAGGSDVTIEFTVEVQQ